jgi:hypothetical protein
VADGGIPNQQQALAHSQAFKIFCDTNVIFVLDFMLRVPYPLCIFLFSFFLFINAIVTY